MQKILDHDRVSVNLVTALQTAVHEVRFSRSVRKILDQLGSETGDYLDTLERLVSDELERMCKGGA